MQDKTINECNLYCKYAKEDKTAYIKEEKLPVQMYGRLLNLAYAALAEVYFKISIFNHYD